jgi:hypothetical protein
MKQRYLSSPRHPLPPLSLRKERGWRRENRTMPHSAADAANNRMEVIMKIKLCVIAVVLLLPVLSFTEPAVIDPIDQEHYVYIEDFSSETASQTIQAFLGLDPFTISAGNDDTWNYYVVHSESARTKILNAFLPRLQRFHRHSKLPFSAVADYWETLFKAPLQIYVFRTHDDPSAEFCTSPACEKIVSTARILGLRFMWNGTLGIAESDIKMILNVPADHQLVTTIFLSHTEKHEVSRAQ